MKNSIKTTKGCDIYVVRVNYKQDGSITTTNSKPCYHCCKAMKRLGIKRVFYSLDDYNYKCEKVSEISTSHKSVSNKRIHPNRIY